MSTANFRCPKTGEELFVGAHITVISSNGGKNTHHYRLAKGLKGGEILSSVGEPMEEIRIPVDWSDGKSPHFGCGSDSNGKQKMQDMLKKRSKKHYKSNIEEQKVSMINKYDKTGEQ